MITISSTGNFNKTDDFLKRMKGSDILSALKKYGYEGEQALASATPVDSGLTSDSWTHEVIEEKGKYAIIWMNTHIVSGIPVAILIQYGHGTGTGGYIQGRDYINPAIQPIFDRIVADVWKVVTKS